MNGVRSLHLGRWQFIVEVRNEADHYGFTGSQGYSLRFTIVRNPA